MRALAAACAVLFVASCSGPTGELRLGWRFADERHCAEAGVTVVTITGRIECGLPGAAPTDSGSSDAPQSAGAYYGDCRFACTDGNDGNTVVASATGGGTLWLDGLSLAGAALYRGTASVDSLAPVTVTLYFTGGH